ncbi:MAG: diguanylate cyclase [Rhodocyclaceae bacterium]|nr:MAG: diguanylate cyclase [Rhodocyclaceae bacterium]
MPDFTQPSEIAREVLVRLAQRRMQPTPDKYLALYHEISGTPPTEIFPERALKGLTAALPRNTPEQAKLARQLDQAVADKDWNGIKRGMEDVFARLGADPLNWSTLLKEVLAQLDTHSAGLTTAKKRESLDHILSASAQPDLLFQRMQGLLRSWTSTPAAGGEALIDPASIALPPAAAAPQGAAPATPASPSASTDLSSAQWRELIAMILDKALPPLLAESPELAAEAAGLSKDIRNPVAAGKLDEFANRLKKFIYRLHFVAEDQAELRAALLGLLRLLVENIDELVVDDQWLQGQIAIVSDLVNQPLNLRRLDDMERRLKDLIFKQGALKKNLNEARDRLKAMLATFVDRLAEMGTATGDYHDKIEQCATRISQSKDIGELTDVLDEVMRETRSVQITALRSKDELTEMRQRVSEAEKEVARLQNELAEASDMVRQDALTGALNRKGMDEALDKEVARSQRQGSKLCVALLDIDNFKKLNDTLGHDAGDAALVHLTQVVRDTIRPQDTLARYGGEEFVVLLPDTILEEGVNAMVRVQRELTRKFFLHNNEKLLITFSCGVAEQLPEEAPKDCLQRADQAMYLAKRSGKNRVMAA